jgi:hypothetical protein
VTPEIAVGLIGAGGALSGALVGGLATFAGVVYQQKRQAAHARDERRTEMAHQAVDIALHQTQELKRLAWPTEKENFQWNQEMGDCLEAIRLALLRIPDKGIRDTFEAACTFQFGASSKMRGELAGVDEPAVRMVVMTGQAQDMLGAYLRGEPVPPEGFLGKALALEQEMYRNIEQGRWSEL